MRPVGVVAIALACTGLVACGGQVVAAAAPPARAIAAAACADAPPGWDSAVAFRTPGGCVPATRLAASWCGGDLPSIVARGAGTPGERRFTGGRFAVTERQLPPTTKPLGEANGVEVIGVPRAPEWLYVRRAGDIQRWTQLPAGLVGSPPTAFFIGDSIADGAEPFLTAALPGWTVGFDAVVGRSSLGGVSPAATVATTPPDVVVVELGTNDSSPEAFTANATQILDSLRGVPLVVWQTVHSPSESAHEINKSIRALAPRYPNVVIADWNHFVPQEELSSDGVHVLPGYEEEMAKLEAPILLSWLSQSTATGPPTCSTSAVSEQTVAGSSG